MLSHPKFLAEDKTHLNLDSTDKDHEQTILQLNHRGYKYLRLMEYEEARKSFEQAYEKGDLTEAACNLGYIYASGLGVEQDYKIAAQYADQAAKMGDPYGLLEMGLAHELGVGVLKKNAQLACQYYKEAALQGEAQALSKMGFIYQSQEEYKKAIEYYEEASSCENVQALYNLGAMYEKGLGVPQNDAKAVEYFKKAIEAGNVQEAIRLEYKMQKTSEGIKEDNRKARKYYFNQSTNAYGFALYALGVMYENGRGVIQNNEEAFNYYLKSTQEDCTEGFRLLGRMYRHGRGVPQNIKKAQECFQKTIERGMDAALFDLGLMYEYDLCDDKAAFNCYKKMADKGDLDGLYFVGLMYQGGQGVQRDYRLAASSFRAAAEKGQVKAPGNLKQLYEDLQHMKNDIRDEVTFHAALVLNDPNINIEFNLLAKNKTAIFLDLLDNNPQYSFYKIKTLLSDEIAQKVYAHMQNIAAKQLNLTKKFIGIPEISKIVVEYITDESYLPKILDKAKTFDDKEKPLVERFKGWLFPQKSKASVDNINHGLKNCPRK